MQIYAVLKVEANSNLSFLFTLRFCDFDLFKANTFFTEGNLIPKVDRQTDRQPLFKHDKLKSCAACGVVRKY